MKKCFLSLIIYFTFAVTSFAMEETKSSKEQNSQCSATNDDETTIGSSKKREEFYNLVEDEDEIPQKPKKSCTLF